MEAVEVTSNLENSGTDAEDVPVGADVAGPNGCTCSGPVGGVDDTRDYQKQIAAALARDDGPGSAAVIAFMAIRLEAKLMFGADLARDLTVLAREGRLDALKWLCREISHITTDAGGRTTTRYGRLILYAAAGGGHLEVCQWALDAFWPGGLVGQIDRDSTLRLTASGGHWSAHEWLRARFAAMPLAPISSVLALSPTAPV